MKNRPSSGFTLVELMIVLAIMTILATYAYPSYQQHINKTRRAEGQILLMDMLARQERFFTENNSYTIGLDNLGYTLNADGAVETEGGFYTITAATCDAATPITNCVELTATPPPGGPQVSDGVLTLNSRNRKRRTTDDGNVHDW